MAILGAILLVLVLGYEKWNCWCIKQSNQQSMNKWDEKARWFSEKFKVYGEEGAVLEVLAESVTDVNAIRAVFSPEGKRELVDNIEKIK